MGDANVHASCLCRMRRVQGALGLDIRLPACRSMTCSPQTFPCLERVQRVVSQEHFPVPERVSGKFAVNVSLSGTIGIVSGAPGKRFLFWNARPDGFPAPLDCLGLPWIAEDCLTLLCIVLALP